MRALWTAGTLFVYRLLLWLLPARFRHAYEDDMLALARERLHRSRGTFRLFRASVSLLADAVVTATAERVRSRRDKPGSRPRKAEGLGARVLNLEIDVARTVRTLAARPAMSLAVVATLALGTGTTLALFTVVDGAVLRPLPYPHSTRLVSIVQSDPRFGLVPFGAPYLQDLQERLSSFDAVVGFSPSWSLTLTGTGTPATVQAAFVSEGALELFGAERVEGRSLEPADFREGAPRAAIVTRAFWDRRVGGPFRETSLRLDGELYTVVGLLSSSLRLPITTSAVSRDDRQGELFLPFTWNPYAKVRAIPVMNVVARLREDAPLERARAELTALGSSLRRDFPDTSQLDVLGVPLSELVTRRSRRVVWTLFGAAAVLLLVSCVNVANLLLARAAERRSEVAIRSSLGATWRHIAGQLLLESLVLAVAGTASGLLLAWWLLSAVPALGLTGLAPSASVAISPQVVLFAAALAVLTSLVFGLAPALLASRLSQAGELRASRAASGGARGRGLLVAAEIALAMMLLVGAGLLARSFWNLVQVDPGFQSAGLLRVPLDLTGDAYDADGRRGFVSSLLERLESLPGVDAVAAVNRLPLSGSNVFVGLEAEGQPASDGASPVVDRRVMTPGYLATMGIPLVAGRDFSPDDRSESPRVAIVNETLARQLWPDGALGRRARLELRSGPGPWLEIVGVAGDVRHHGLDSAAEPELYVPYAQAAVGTVIAVVRAREPLALAATIRQEIWELDDAIPLEDLGTVSALVSRSVAEPRFRMLVLNGFGGLALLLAAVGVYGVTAYLVTCQTREIAVRIALGARTPSVLGLVLGRGMTPALLGVALGAAGALLLGGYLRSLLFEVEPADAVTLVSASLVLLGTSALASYLPARRALRIEPVRALRLE